MKATARKAGALALRFAQGTVKSWDKAPGDPVSEADLAVNQVIKDALLGARPDYGWLSEECADNKTRLDKHRLWVVDPIDGTRAFLKNKPEYVISIALLEGNSPILAALYDPCRDILYHAAKGGGAWRDDQAISVSNRKHLKGARMLAAKDVVKASLWPEDWPPMDIAKPNSIALRLAWVAEGAWDAAFCVRAKSDWDLAAAALLLEEAGGALLNHEGARLQFNQPKLRHPTLIASGPGLQKELVRRIHAGWQAKASKR